MNAESTFTLVVNGETRTVTTDPERPLLDVLREDCDLTGTKYGCGEGRCRACTVLADGRPILACVTPVSKASGKHITTIEGLASEGALHAVQKAFLEEEAMQCGYCIPGMIMQTIALLERHPEPTDAEIIEGLNGNVCRCCGYVQVLAAVKRAAHLRNSAEVS